MTSEPETHSQAARDSRADQDHGPNPSLKRTLGLALRLRRRLILELDINARPIEPIRAMARIQGSAAFGNLCALLLLLAVLWGQVPRLWLLGWFGCALAVVFCRTLLVPGVGGPVNPGRSARAWGRRMLAVAAGLALVHLPVPWLPGVTADPLVFMFVICILFGICGSAAMTLSAYSPAFTALSYPVLGSCMLAGIAYGATATIATGIACFVFLLYATRHQLATTLALEAVRRNDHDRLLLATEARRRATDLTAANAQLQATLTSLQATRARVVQQEKLASLGQLVAGVAHEINTPLGIALTMATQLAGQELAVERALKERTLRLDQLEAHLAGMREGFALLVRNLERAGNLVRSFKQVAADQNSDAVRRLELGAYVGDVLLSLEPLLQGARVRLTLDVGGAFPITTRAGALAQVLVNLVQNAVFHAFAGIEEPEIIVGVRAGPGDRIQLVVEDNGTGMTPDVKSRVFDPFFTTRRDAGGTGLGLHIVHTLVTGALGGDIDLDSRPGQGACFTITLPVSLPPVSDGPARDGSPVVTASSPAPEA